jgi:UDP-N-acetyl-D-glucosamine dehydrogenase
MGTDLLKKIEDRTATIAVIGLGYVGLPMCVEFARAGFPVIGIDNNPARVADLKEGHSYILDISEETLKSIAPRLSPTTDYSTLVSADAIIICVPTPLRKTKDPDLSFIISAANEVKKYLKKGQLIILESTTYPGTTDEIVLSELEEKGFKLGIDLYLAFSPERIDPGNREYTLKNTPKIVGGHTEQCGKMSEALYRSICEKVVRVSSTKSAEMVKLLENTFRAINIGMVNEIAIMCEKLGIDTWEVIYAAATKPFGFMPFYPGPGLGGHCIPVDPHYLSWKLKMLNYSARFIELASEVNSGMPRYVVSRISDALNDACKSVKGSRIVVLGVAYKKNSNDFRESPALDILSLLLERQADVKFHDPYIFQIRFDHDVLHSSLLEPRLLESADCVVIVTDHSCFDWQWIVNHSRLIMDTRNATQGTAVGTCKIVKL